MRLAIGGATAVAAALTILGCARTAESNAPAEPAPPFKPVTTVLELMDSVIVHAAEVYWESVAIIVDENGVTENYPETDEEWEGVWAAALTLAESGNLLMMAPRAVDDGPWMEFSIALVDVGAEAAAAALARDPDRVLAMGEQVYNVCLACHTRYIAPEE